MSAEKCTCGGNIKYITKLDLYECDKCGEIFLSNNGDLSEIMTGISRLRTDSEFRKRFNEQHQDI